MAPRRLAIALVLFLAAGFAPLGSVTPDAIWPQFRGPAGRGVSEIETLPTSWSTTKNVAWRTKVPGRGWSSPIVWGDQVVVTSAISPGAFKQPSPGIYGNDFVAELEHQGLSPEEVLKRLRGRDIESTQEAGEVQYVVYSFDIATGNLRWQQEAHRGAPLGRHRKNTYASETPATDGERIYALFGNVGLFCYTMNGTLLWTHRIEPRARYLDFGTASSPVVHAGRVYLLDDNEVSSYIAALDAKTGVVLWRTPRTAGRGRPLSGWSTPYVWVSAKRTEIVAIGRSLAMSYDLNGKELWRLHGLTQANPTPTEGDGILYVATGSQGESNRPLFAVKPGARGDISLKNGETSNEFLAWYQPRASAYTSSPLVFGGRVYALNNNGVVAVFDAKTGRQLYQARVGGVGNTFSASPWAYGGKIFCLSEEGDTFVLNPGDTYDEVAKNTLGEMTLATPAVTRDGLFVRTASQLYRIH